MVRITKVYTRTGDTGETGRRARRSLAEPVYPRITLESKVLALSTN